MSQIHDRISNRNATQKTQGPPERCSWIQRVLGYDAQCKALSPTPQTIDREALRGRALRSLGELQAAADAFKRNGDETQYLLTQAKANSLGVMIQATYNVPDQQLPGIKAQVDELRAGVPGLRVKQQFERTQRSARIDAGIGTAKVVGQAAGNTAAYMTGPLAPLTSALIGTGQDAMEQKLEGHDVDWAKALKSGAVNGFAQAVPVPNAGKYGKPMLSALSGYALTKEVK